MSDKVREEFEAWMFDHLFEPKWSVWQAAYAAGRAAGMEEAAALCDAVNRDRETAMAKQIREAAK